MMVPARDETRTKVFGTLWVMSPRGGPWPLWPLFVPSIFPTQRLLEMKVLVLCINFPSIRKSPLTSSLVPLLYFLLPCSVNGEGVRGRRACLSETLIADAVQLQVGEGVKRRHSNWLCVPENRTNYYFKNALGKIKRSACPTGSGFLFSSGNCSVAVP